MLLIQILKGKGPSTEPCGTPDLTSSQLLYVDLYGNICEGISLSNIFDRVDRTLFGRKFILQVESSDFFRLLRKVLSSNYLFTCCLISSLRTLEAHLSMLVGTGLLLFFPAFSALISFNTANESIGLNRMYCERRCALL